MTEGVGQYPSGWYRGSYPPVIQVAAILILTVQDGAKHTRIARAVLRHHLADFFVMRLQGFGWFHEARDKN